MRVCKKPDMLYRLSKLGGVSSITAHGGSLARAEAASFKETVNLIQR